MSVGPLVLFIDPGTSTSGYCIVKKIHAEQPIYHVLSGEIDNENLISRLDAFSNDFNSRSLDVPIRIGCERVVCYGGGDGKRQRVVGREVLETAHFGGMAFASMKLGLIYRPAAFYRPSRPMVLKHVTGRSNSSKAELNECLYERFGRPGTKAKPGLLYGMDQHQRDSFAGCIWLLEAPDKIDFNADECNEIQAQ